MHFEVTFEGKDYACPFGARGEHLTCIGVPGAEGAVDISDFLITFKVLSRRIHKLSPSSLRLQW